MSQQIPVGSVLGGRYEITAHIIITAESDMVLEGTDQILSHQIYLSVVGLSFCPYNRALSSIIPFLGDPYPDTPRTVNL